MFSSIISDSNLDEELLSICSDSEIINIDSSSDSDLNSESDIEIELDEHIEKIKEINQMHKSEPNYKILDDVDKPLGISGLINLGNTCYMNSIIQCLLNAPKFKDKIANPHIIKELYNYVVNTLDISDRTNYSMILAKSQLTITFQLFKIFNLIWKDQSKHITPTNFKKIFSHKIVNFQNFNQHDAQEALICILDTIHSETETKIDIKYNIFTEEYLILFKQMEEQQLSDIECCKMEFTFPDIWELFSLKKTIDRYNINSYSSITHTFQNIISSTLECPECNYHSYNFDPTIILSIQIPTELLVDIDEINSNISKIPNIFKKGLSIYKHE
jgi:ubiquitin C-terminal hydrolase